MQDILTAGDSLNFPASTPGYPATEGWVLKYRLVPRTTGNPAIALTATADGDGHRVQVDASTTATWAAGTYGWAAWVEKAAEKYTVQTGQMVIKPDPRSAAAGADTRSLPRRTLDDLLAARATWASTHGRTRRYKIGDREREFASAVELDAEIRFWQGQLNEELMAERLASGRPALNRLHVRFTRPR